MREPSWIFLQPLVPVLDVGSRPREVGLDTQVNGDEHRRQLGDHLLHCIGIRAKARVELAILTGGVPCPVRQLMQQRAVVSLGFVEPGKDWHGDGVIGRLVIGSVRVTLMHGGRNRGDEVLDVRDALRLVDEGGRCSWHIADDLLRVEDREATDNTRARLTVLVLERLVEDQRRALAALGNLMPAVGPLLIGGPALGAEALYLCAGPAGNDVHALIGGAGGVVDGHGQPVTVPRWCPVAIGIDGKDLLCDFVVRHRCSPSMWLSGGFCNLTPGRREAGKGARAQLVKTGCRHPRRNRC